MIYGHPVLKMLADDHFSSGSMYFTGGWYFTQGKGKWNSNHTQSKIDFRGGHGLFPSSFFNWQPSSL
jgi:hypothetical protein